MDVPDLVPAGGLESAAASGGGAEDGSGGPRSTREGFFPALDGVRALAALAVVVTHVGFHTGTGVTGPYRSVLSRLDVGVAVFFVLSGFLLHRPQVAAALAGRPLPAVVPYLWRRALRVLPGAWLAVVAALVILPANDGAGLGTWVQHLTLTQIYTDAPQPAALTQLWSLATEVSFYLALPLLGRLAGGTVRRQLLLCAALGGSAIAWRVLVGLEVLPLHAGYWLPAHLDWFGLGMALAVLSAGGVSWFEELAADGITCWVGAAALFVVAGTPLTGPYGLALSTAGEALLRALLYAAVAGLLVLPAVSRRPSGPVALLLTSWPAQQLGRISYGVFLLHLVVLEAVEDGLRLPLFSGGFWRVLALVLPITVAVAWASLRLVEEPALRLRSWGPGRPRDADRRPPGRRVVLRARG